MTNRIFHFLLHGPEYKPRRAMANAVARPFYLVLLMGLCYAASYGFQLYWVAPLDFHPEDIITFTRYFEGRLV